MKISILYRSFIFFSTIVLTTFSSCIKEKVDEQENLNVLKIKIGSNTFTWSDTDGAGGAAPKIDTIRLTPNGSFASEIVIQDGSVSPVTDFTPEIIAEKNDHLFIYKTSGNVSVIDLSIDANGKAFGQTATVKTTAAGTGSINIILKHLPNKSATDPSATGETDLDITFPVLIL